LSGWTILLVILVLLPVGLLSFPLTFKARGSLRKEERNLNLQLSWGWGLLSAAVEINGKESAFRLRLAGFWLPVPRKKPVHIGTTKTGKQTGRAGKQAQKHAGRRKKHGFSLFSIIAVLNRQVLATVLDYLKRLFKSLRLRLRLNGVYGTDDPAMTGLIAGLIAALHAKHLKFDLDADFSGPIIDLAGETSGRLIPIVILWHTMSFFLAKPVRKLWWSMFKIKKTWFRWGFTPSEP